MGHLKMLHKERVKKNFPKAIVLGTKRSLGRGKVSGLIRWTGRRNVIMGIAPQRTGKSVLMFRNVEETFRKFDLPWLVIDPKKEFYVHKKKLKSEYHKYLSLHPNEVIGDPQELGKDMIVITPNSLKDSIEYTDHLVSPHLTDFLALNDSNLREELLLEFLELTSDNLIATRRMLQVTLQQMVEEKTENQTFKRWIHYCWQYIEDLPTSGMKPYSLIVKITSLINAEKVEVKKTFPLTLVNNLLLEKKIVVVQTNLSSTPIAEYDVAMTLMISLCVQNRRFYKNSFGVFIDEIDKPCGNNRKKSLLKQTIIDIPLKYGAFNIWLVGITQKPKLVDPTLFDQADCIVGSRWTIENIQWITDHTGCTSNIGRMALAGLRSGQTPKVEWIILFPNFTIDLYDDDGELVPVTAFQKFYPLPTRSAFHEVGVVSG